MKSIAVIIISMGMGILLLGGSMCCQKNVITRLKEGNQVKTTMIGAGAGTGLGAVIGSTLGGIGVAMCGTGIGIPAGILLGGLGGLIGGAIGHYSGEPDKEIKEIEDAYAPWQYVSAIGIGIGLIIIGITLMKRESEPDDTPDIMV